MFLIFSLANFTVSQFVISPKNIYFCQRQQKPYANFSYCTLRFRFSLRSSSPKKINIRTSLSPFWTVLWRHSIWLISSKWHSKSLFTTPLGFGCSFAILFWAKHAPNSEMGALKIVKWIIAWKNIDFADLVKDAKSPFKMANSKVAHCVQGDFLSLPSFVCSVYSVLVKYLLLIFLNVNVSSK